MVKTDFSSELKKLLALEYNCAESDVGGAENVLTVSSGNGGRRYSPDNAFFSMATTGSNCLITANERMQPFLRDFIVRGEQGHWLFEEGKLAELERELNCHGYKLQGWGAHHMFLPKYSVEVSRKFPVKRLDGYDCFKEFYGDKRFPNALCGKYLPERPDEIVLMAFDGDKIMGMAGASRDYEGSPSWLQIGIDVLSEYRCSGVGTFLVNELKNIILESGDIPFYGTSPANIYSQNIAINCGFRPAWVEIAADRIRNDGMDDKEKNQPGKNNGETSDDKTWVDDMKQELEDYIEEQGIYIRQ